MLNGKSELIRQRHHLNPSWKWEAKGHSCIFMTSRWTWQIFVMSHKHETLSSLLDRQEDLWSLLSTTCVADPQNTNIYLTKYTMPIWHMGNEAAQKTLILFAALTSPPHPWLWEQSCWWAHTTAGGKGKGFALGLAALLTCSCTHQLHAQNQRPQSYSICKKYVLFQ